MTTYSADELLKIVAKWSTERRITQLKKIEASKTRDTNRAKVVFPGIRAFYADIKMDQNMGNVETLNPFFQKSLGPAFDPTKVSIEDFKIFIGGVSRLVYCQDMPMDSMLAAKTFIKAHLKRWHGSTLDYTDPYVVAWNSARLNIQANELKAKREVSEAKITEKNSNKFYIPKRKVESFYRSFCFKENPDLIDKIITVQATMGLRLIEALSSKVSTFTVDGLKIKQNGTAKMKQDQIKVVAKRPIIVDSDMWIKTLDEVRTQTDEYKNLTNVAMSNRYLERVNERISEYLKKAGIPAHGELKSSHGLRRLYVAYAYSLQDAPNLTFHQFIKESLGHAGGGYTANYNTIEIVNPDGSEPEPDGSEPEPEPEPTPSGPTFKLTKATAVKFAVFQTAWDQGKRSYEALERVGIPGTGPQKYLTRNMIAKFKKLVR